MPDFVWLWGLIMRRFQIALLTAAAIMGLAASASAADMPTKGPVSKAVAPIYNWTGFYIGIEGGGGWADTQHTNATNGVNSGTTRISGGLFGGTYGYNAQFGSWVLGLEGDFSWSGIKKDFVTLNNNNFCTVGFECVTNLRWLGTDRARVGYAWDRLLVYGTAGVAYGSVEATIRNSSFAVGNSTRVGFIYGGGVEWAFAPAWSVKAEYLRTDLGDKHTYSSNSGTVLENVSLKKLDIVRFGLNYHFH